MADNQNISKPEKKSCRLRNDPDTYAMLTEDIDVIKLPIRLIISSFLILPAHEHLGIA